MPMLHIVKVKNLGKRTIDLPHLGTVTHLKPGQEAVVQWDCATSLFGDPTLVDARNNPLRADRYAAVRAQWGFLAGFDVEDEATRKAKPADIRDLHSSWEAHRPHIRVSTVDTDEEIVMLIDDPLGAEVLPSAVTGRDAVVDVSNPAQVQATIDQLQAELARLSNTVTLLESSKSEKPESKVHKPLTHDKSAEAVVKDPVELPEEDGPVSRRK